MAGDGRWLWSGRDWSSSGLGAGARTFPGCLDFNLSVRHFQGFWGNRYRPGSLSPTTIACSVCMQSCLGSNYVQKEGFCDLQERRKEKRAMNGDPLENRKQGVGVLALLPSGLSSAEPCVAT